MKQSCSAHSKIGQSCFVLVFMVGFLVTFSCGSTKPEDFSVDDMFAETIFQGDGTIIEKDELSFRIEFSCITPWDVTCGGVRHCTVSRDLAEVMKCEIIKAESGESMECVEYELLWKHCCPGRTDVTFDDSDDNDVSPSVAGGKE